MRILFMGTPDFAVASLRRLVEDGHEICGVFTQPDKPKNRGHKLAFSPVKEYALSQGLTVYQPTKLRDGTALELIRTLAPELTVVAAYGRILPEDILAAPKLGSINVHSSLLPKYRGAAPINWAVLNGDAVTGVTIMYMAKELDAGDIISAAETPIDPDEDALTLTNRLANELERSRIAQYTELLNRPWKLIGATTHIHPSPISATVPPTTTHPGCPEGGAPMGSPLANLKVVGLMTMAPHEEDPELTRPVFRGLRELRDQLNGQALTAEPLTELSMGMSNDFEVAIEEGATWVRLDRKSTRLNSSHSSVSRMPSSA